MLFQLSVTERLLTPVPDGHFNKQGYEDNGGAMKEISKFKKQSRPLLNAQGSYLPPTWFYRSFNGLVYEGFVPSPYETHSLI